MEWHPNGRYTKPSVKVRAELFDRSPSHFREQALSAAWLGWL
jgi:hypothetical protein